MKQFLTRVCIVVCVSVAFLACEKNAQNPVDDSIKAPLSIEFDNIMGGYNLQLNTGVYKNAAGEDFTVDLLQYYISNVKLKKADQMQNDSRT